MAKYIDAEAAKRDGWQATRTVCSECSNTIEVRDIDTFPIVDISPQKDEWIDVEYPFIVYQATSNGHTFWVAEHPDLKLCVGQGETADEAISELRENAKIWMETAESVGIPIPEVPVRDLDTERALANAPEKDPFNDLTTREKMEADIAASITMIVRRARDELGMSQKEFAEHVGMPEDLISRLESSDYSLKWADTPEYDKDNRIKNQRHKIQCLKNRLSKQKRRIELLENRLKLKKNAAQTCWIPVGEQLPEKDRMVLTCFKSDDMAVACVFER